MSFFNRALPRHRDGNHSRNLYLTLVVSATLVGSMLIPAAAQSATRPIVFGASGNVSGLAKASHATLAQHTYGQLNGPVKGGRFVNMQPNVSWRTLANSRWSSAPHKNLVRWAKALKSRSGPVLFSFSHEPEGKSSLRKGYGTSRDFVAAWRKVYQVFKSQGANNVEFTWTVTSNSFRVKPGDRRYATKWYPGNAYVDNIATAAYNWYNCSEGRGQWLSLANRAALPLKFARAHHKPYVLAEWGSDASPRRAQWLRDARAFMLANKSSIRGAFYFQSRDPRGCKWFLNTSSEFSAFGSMARDRANFGG